jgi:hypothetical protein
MEGTGTTIIGSGKTTGDSLTIDTTKGAVQVVSLLRNLTIEANASLIWKLGTIQTGNGAVLTNKGTFSIQFQVTFINNNLVRGRLETGLFPVWCFG